MPASSAERRVLASRVAGYKRRRSADDPAVVEAVQQLAESRAEDVVRKLVDAAPQLTEASRQRLAVLLLTGGEAS